MNQVVSMHPLLYSIEAEAVLLRISQKLIVHQYLRFYNYLRRAAQPC